MNQLLLGTLCLLAMAAGAFGHGRLMDPPGRSTAWRFGFDTPKYYNDNELNCGGLRVSNSIELTVILFCIVEQIRLKV